MFDFLKNKLTQMNVNRYKKEMKDFLYSLKMSTKDEKCFMLRLAETVHMQYMTHYDCDLYAPFSSIKKYPGLDMALFRHKEKAQSLGDRQSEKAIELWLHTIRGTAYSEYTGHHELFELAREIWFELGRCEKIHYPEGFM